MRKLIYGLVLSGCVVASGAAWAQSKKPASKRSVATKPTVTAVKKPAGPEPKVTPLTPAAFAKFKASAKGQVLIINFWATWCGPCIAEFPEFVAIDAKYKERGVRMVSISADELTDLRPKVVGFLRDQKANFEHFIQDTDDPQQMMDVVEAKDWSGVLPVTVVFDKQGNAVYTRFGIINREELIAAIEKSL